MILSILLSTSWAAYTEGSAGSGSVTGKVTLSGAAPAADKMSITKDAEVCGDGQRVVGEVVLGSGNSVVGAVVYLSGVESGKEWSTPSGGYVLNQEGCAFLPQTRVVRRGAQLDINNIDPVFHNIHAYELVGSARISMFNEGQQPNTDMQKPMRMRRPDSHVIKLECDAHDFMHEWLFVADNPYYASTGKDGSFSIEGVPDGTYTLSVWHPQLGDSEATVTVSGGALSQDLSF